MLDLSDDISKDFLDLLQRLLQGNLDYSVRISFRNIDLTKIKTYLKNSVLEIVRSKKQER